MAALPGGEYPVMWGNLGAPADGIFLRRLSAAGLPIGAGIQVSQTDHDCVSRASLGQPELCTIQNPTAGTWWIGVLGFDVGAVSFQLRVLTPEPPFFADGFESGNTIAWSSTSP
ncbi:MAG: hypothetical protein MI919_07655 [Holophagales bacterium]|nr:hypothetical protein [Holophagales bacterium]